MRDSNNFGNIFIYLPIILPLYFIISPIINGGEEIYRIHDQLDSLGPFVALKNSSEFFSLNPNTIVPNLMNGVPRAFMNSPFNLNCIVFYFFGVLNGLIINNLLIRVIGFLGMYLLLNKYLLKSPNAKFISILVSSLFASAPIFEAFGLGSLGFPLLTYCILEIYNKQSNWNYLGVILFCWYSYFFHTGFFFIIILGIVFAILLLIEKRINKEILFVLIIMIITSLIVEYLTIYNFLYPNSFISHRTEFNVLNKNWSLFTVIKVAFYTISHGNYHSGNYSGLIILIFSFICISLSFLFKKNYLKILTTLCLLYLIGLTSEIFNWSKITALYSIFPIAKSFNFSRIDFMLIFIIFVLLAYALEAIDTFNLKYKHLSRLIISSIFIVLSFNIRTLKYEMENDANKKNCSINKYYSANLYNKINDEIHFRNNKFNLIHIGIDPSISQVNGAKTLDAYMNNYPLDYKKEFRKIMTEEIDNPNMPLKKKNYFDKWGNRCYIVFYNKPINNSLLISLNSQQLKKMNCKYVLSAFEIINATQNNFVFFKAFVDENSYLKKVFVYEVI